MASEIVLPQWGMEMQDGTIVRWLKQEGDTIEEGEPIVEVETAKLQTELESTASGILSRIVAQEGEIVPIRGVLCVIAEPGRGDCGGGPCACAGSHCPGDDNHAGRSCVKWRRCRGAGCTGGAAPGSRTGRGFVRGAGQRAQRAHPADRRGDGFAGTCRSSDDCRRSRAGARGAGRAAVGAGQRH